MTAATRRRRSTSGSSERARSAPSIPGATSSPSTSARGEASVSVKRISVENRNCGDEQRPEPPAEPAAAQAPLEEPQHEERRERHEEDRRHVQVVELLAEQVAREAEQVPARERGPERPCEVPAEQERRPGGERRHRIAAMLYDGDGPNGERHAARGAARARARRRPGEVVAVRRPEHVRDRTGSRRAGPRAATSRTTRRRAAGPGRRRRQGPAPGKWPAARGRRSATAEVGERGQHAASRGAARRTARMSVGSTEREPERRHRLRRRRRCGEQ